MRILAPCALLLLFLATGFPATAEDRSTTLHAGPLTLDVHTASRTAHLFHVVDQLSGWSEFCHPQYRRYFERPENGGLSPADESLLAEHAALRKRKGYGQGPEQTFYTPQDLDSALRAGVNAGRLTQAEADTERRVFLHFAPRVEALMQSDAAHVAAFATTLTARQAELAAFATKAGRLFGVKDVAVPVYLFANPDDTSIGGGYNGGVLTLEVPRQRNAFPSFQHEIFHAFLDRRAADLARVAAAVPGLDAQTLNEGLAYALSPGLLHTGGKGADPLADRVRADIGKPFTDSYTRYNRYGLALRPLVKAALDDEKQTLDTLLPRAADAWRTIAEVSLALEGGKTISPPAAQGTSRQGPNLYSFGPGWEALDARARLSGAWLAARDYDPGQYHTALAAPDDVAFVLLYAPDAETPAREFSQEFRDVLPLSWDVIQADLLAGKVVEARGKAHGREVILLAAPTTERLRTLIGQTTVLDSLLPTHAIPLHVAQDGRRHIYSFGPGWRALNDVANARGGYLAAFNYATEHFEKSLRSAAPGTPVVFLYSLDSPDRNVTPEFARLFPRPVAEVEAALQRGETVEVTGQSGGFNVVLLAAPTTERLTKLIGETTLLDRKGILTP